MKKTLLLLALIVAGAQTIHAQKVEIRNSDRNDPYREMRRLAATGHTNLGLSIQTMTMTDRLLGQNIELNSVADWGATISRSRTFVLHRRPLARTIYIGLEATWIDINYAQYGNNIMGIDVSDLADGYRLHQADISMLGIGPSVNVFPVGKLGLHAYIKYNPTIATLFTTYDEFQMWGGYSSVFTAGTAASWGVISAGVETRFGSGRYDVRSDEGSDLGKIRTGGVRVYLSLRY